jgi:hypothetical protein
MSGLEYRGSRANRGSNCTGRGLSVGARESAVNLPVKDERFC